MSPKIRTTTQDIQLSIVQAVYKSKMTYEKYPEGDMIPQEKKILIKEMRVRKWFKKEAITSVEEYVTVKNTIAKNRSLVFDKYSGRFYATWHNAEEVMTRLNEPLNKSTIGFNYGNNLQTRETRVHKY